MADLEARSRESRPHVVKAWKKIVDIAVRVEGTGVRVLEGADIPLGEFPMGCRIPKGHFDV